MPTDHVWGIIVKSAVGFWVVVLSGLTALTAKYSYRLATYGFKRWAER